MGLNYLILFVTVIFTSCSKDDYIIPSETFKEISNITTFYGDSNSKTVIVYAQGGPDITLVEEELLEAISFSQTQNVLWAHVHQVQTKDPELFNDEITFEQAKTHVQSSIDYLEQVVNYFDSKSYDKIYVLGVSYGAFLTQEYIAQHGLNLVDGFLISVGRLDMDEEVWTTFSEGNEAVFDYDSNGDYTIQIMEKSSSGDRNGNKITAAVGYNRYTEKLAAYDLTKVTYFSGAKDEFVGKISDEEIQFFMDKNINLNIIPNANHNETTARALENLKDIFNIQ